MCPYNPRKVLALIATLIGLSSVSCFADSLYLAVNATPYDKQMTRIQPVLLSKSQGHRDLSLAVVNHWIQDLRSIPYGYTAEWKTPSEVQTGAFADCKGKAVALYKRMHEAGAQNVRLVIGRRTASSAKTHAWLEWTTKNGRYLLDPTINWSASPVREVSNDSYVPLYAYAGEQKFRVSGDTLVATN
jgi:predicted transglutaminase-like cysteine proteinase